MGNAATERKKRRLKRKRARESEEELNPYWNRAGYKSEEDYEHQEAMEDQDFCDFLDCGDC